jgi:hypothetical protein
MKKYLISATAVVGIIIIAFGIGILAAQFGKSHPQPSVNQKLSGSQTPPPADQEIATPQAPASVEPKGIASDPATANINQTLNLPAANSSPNSVTFAVIGDTKTFSAGNSNGNLQKAVRSLSQQKFDLAFVMGDLLSSCDGASSCEKNYADWKNVMSPILPKTYEVQGNHDRTDGDKADAVWQKVFSLPINGPAGFSELTYSFDAGNSHFVVLDSEKPQEQIINDVQRNWLEQDLAANKKENIFVFFHEPAFKMSQKSEDGLDANPGERDKLWNILKKHKVAAVFNGHFHMIARKSQDGIQQFVIGDTDSTAEDVPQKNLTDFGLTGHHYAIVSVTGKTVDVKIYSLDGNLENDFSF